MRNRHGNGNGIENGISDWPWTLAGRTSCWLPSWAELEWARSIAVAVVKYGCGQFSNCFDQQQQQQQQQREENVGKTLAWQLPALLSAHKFRIPSCFYLLRPPFSHLPLSSVLQICATRICFHIFFFLFVFFFFFGKQPPSLLRISVRFASEAGQVALASALRFKLRRLRELGLN